MALEKYNAKRNFNKTPEPHGDVGNKGATIFVVQKHAASHLHYDFRLAINGVLKSWAVPKGPCLDPAIKRLAVEVEDHPLSYAKFEGIIPKGQYGGGTVMLWDYGVWHSEEDLATSYATGTMHFNLQGSKLTGGWKLVKTQAKGSQSQWLLIKVKDEAARSIADYDVTSENKSVLTNRILEEIANANQQSSPNEIQPELATLVKEVPEGDDWLHEVKFDGYRILAFIDKTSVKLFSRNGKNWTHKFSVIANALKSLHLGNAIFDGELVVLDAQGVSNFQLLQNALSGDNNANYHYYIFDILF